MYKEPRVGRPPKDIEEKMGQTFRCLGTKAVKEYWQNRAKALDMTESQLLRLAIFQFIGPWVDAPLDDPMFEGINR